MGSITQINNLSALRAVNPQKPSATEESTRQNNFTYLPSYSPPRHGPLSYLPEFLHPYIQLMRLDRPKPSVYFLIPHLVGSLQAAVLLRSATSTLFRTNIILCIGTFFLRGATCTWNDIVDVDFDRQVERCSHRPLARGALSIRSAIIFTIAQAICGCGVLLLLPDLCWLYALPSVLGWLVYPFGKRFTDCPQLVLGLPMAWGVFMGAVAMGADPLQLQQAPFDVFRVFASSAERGECGSNTFLHSFAANWAWNLCYETMYSYQDVKDDQRAGVRNVALILGTESGKSFLTGCALVDLLFLYWSGHAMGAGAAFMTLSIGCKAAALLWMLLDVDLSRLDSIAWWFRNGGYIAGGAMLGGLLAEFRSRTAQG